MLNRASSISFDSVAHNGRPQFNPATGSWVFGLAAFAAGVAVNKVIKSNSKIVANDLNSRQTSEDKELFRETSMRSLLRDTMAEESRSSEYVDNISAEVARLRDEIASLTSKRNEFQARPVEESNYIDREFQEARAKLEELHKEKDRLTATERELQQILSSKVKTSPYADLAEKKLSEVEQELNQLKNEQEQIQAEYDFSREDATKAHVEMEKLQQQLQDKILKLQEAEVREQALRRDYQVLMETVESLKTQLEFFRNKATQDQSGVTSLRILEESNSKLHDQVSTSLHQTEQQQATLQRLSYEKTALTKQLEDLKAHARLSEEKMSSLEKALLEAKDSENKLLAEIDRLSQQLTDANSSIAETKQLEDKLKAAQANIENLELKEQELLHKLKEAERINVLNDNAPLVNQLTQERDKLQKALEVSDKDKKEIESNFREKLLDANLSGSSAKSELILASEKEVELNDKIANLQGKVKSLENERDFLKSQAEVVNLKATNAGNDFMSLMQTIHKLESEKKSLGHELERFKSDAEYTEKRLQDAQRKIEQTNDDHRRQSDEITRIKSNIGESQKLSEDYEEQARELGKARAHIEELLVSHQGKDNELKLAQSELLTLRQEIAGIGAESNRLHDSEKLSVNTIAQIQAELAEKDQLIANSKVQEDTFRREIEVLRQTAGNMESEILRLNQMQTNLGSSSTTSLDLLRATEAQLKEQVVQANSEIAKQHAQLLDAERTRSALEIKQREESLQLSLIQSENEGLKNQLTALQREEVNKQGFISDLNKDKAHFEGLEREAQLLKQHQDELLKQLDHSRANEIKLQNELNRSQKELKVVIQQRDLLQQELDSVANELRSVKLERDQLKASSEKLQSTLADLELKKGSGLRIQNFDDTSKQVITLTESDAVSSQIKHESKLDFSEFENIAVEENVSVQVDDEKVDGFSPLTTSPLFQSSKASADAQLRKFKGHKKIEDVEEKERELDHQIEENLESNKGFEFNSLLDSENTSEQEHSDKKKAYSPNRSFADLLEDSERRKVETKVEDLEVHWNDLDGQADEILEEEKTSFKPLVYGIAGASLVVGAFGFLYQSAQNDKADNVEAETNGVSNSNAAVVENGITFDPTIPTNPVIENFESDEMKQKVLAVLDKFHGAKDFEEKARFCRLPKRTLRDLKLYSINNKQDFVVKDVKLEPTTYKKSGLDLIVADVTVQLDGDSYSKKAYFERGENGELLLDWHNYVKFESAPWNKFVNFDDNDSVFSWHVVVDQREDNDDHPEFPQVNYACFKLKSWNPNADGFGLAYLSRSHPKYTELIDEYASGKKTFILKLKHAKFGANALIIEDVISVSEFYTSDIDSSVSTHFGEVSFGNSSY